MAFVVNQNQQVRTTGTRPVAVYSRVVSLTLPVRMGTGFQYSFTPVLGNDIWLLGVTVRKRIQAIDQGQITRFAVVTGGVKPNTLGDVQGWENVLPVYDVNGNIVDWFIYDGEPNLFWGMSRFYEGKARRFAVYGDRDGQDTDVLKISFEISEG